MNSPHTAYSKTQIILHWLTAIAVITAIATRGYMAETARMTWEAGGDPFPTIHTASGALAFVLILVRLWVRRSHGAPPPQGTPFEQMAVEWGHRLLYGLLILVPLLGAITWFGGVQGLGFVHKLAGMALALAALGHAAMAIFHQVVKKDGTLMRMLKPR